MSEKPCDTWIVGPKPLALEERVAHLEKEIERLQKLISSLEDKHYAPCKVRRRE